MRRRFPWVHAVAAGVLTAAGVTLCMAGIDLIRPLQPQYPAWVTIGPFSPPPLFQAFHSRLGVVQLPVLFVIAVAAAWRWTRQRRPIAFVHLVVLIAAVAVHALAMHWALAVRGFLDPQPTSQPVQM